MALKQVKQSAIIKIALLLAILASLPKTIFLYDMLSQGNLDLSGLWISDLLYRLVFSFFFSWSILELNANISYSKFEWSTPVRMTVLVLINIAVLLATLTVFKFLYPAVMDTEMMPRDKGFLNFTYINLLGGRFVI